jgi:hypothetical protein
MPRNRTIKTEGCNSNDCKQRKRGTGEKQHQEMLGRNAYTLNGNK